MTPGPSGPERRRLNRRRTCIPSTPTPRRAADAPRGPARLEFPYPPPDFDPLEASPDELAKYGLPPRPDEEAQPALLHAWLRLFQRPLEFVDPRPIALQALVRPPPAAPAPQLASTRILDSRNWSGASIVPNGGKQFVAVVGEWTVPKPSAPPEPDQLGDPAQTNEYVCSTWIGLDGDRRYRNASLPQIGTQQSVQVAPGDPPSPSYAAFFQWWAAQETAKNLETLTGLAIEGGEEVIALLWAIDPFHVVALLRTFGTLNQIAVLVRPAPPITLENNVVTFPSISGATAEWIVERVRDGNVLLPFANYGTVDFSNCVAGTATAPGAPTGEEILEGPRLLRMYEVPPNPPVRTRLISTPYNVDTTEIGVRYGSIRP